MILSIYNETLVYILLILILITTLAAMAILLLLLLLLLIPGIKDLRVYMSEKEYFSDFSNASALIWKENDIYYDWQDSNNREKFVAFPNVPEVNQHTLSLSIVAYWYCC